MTIRYPKLQEHFHGASAAFKDYPSEQIPVVALLDAWCWFNMIEGADSSGATEAIEHLLSMELRNALRAWYQQCGDNMNPHALAFRDRLGKLAGEKFG